jgi:hypothetical protein
MKELKRENCELRRANEIIAPSTYYEQKSRDADPSKRPRRAVHDAALRE